MVDVAFGIRSGMPDDKRARLQDLRAVPCAAFAPDGLFRGVFSPALAGGAAQKGEVRGPFCVHKIKHNEFQQVININVDTLRA